MTPPKRVHNPVGEDQSPKAEAEEDVAPAEVRRERRPKPHERDVHHRVEGQGNRAVRIRRIAQLLGDHILDGVVEAQRLQAVFLKLVHQVERHGEPRQPH